jgi:hypothetical protein
MNQDDDTRDVMTEMIKDKGNIDFGFLNSIPKKMRNTFTEQDYIDYLNKLSQIEFIWAFVHAWRQRG